MEVLDMWHLGALGLAEIGLVALGTWWHLSLGTSRELGTLGLGTWEKWALEYLTLVGLGIS